MRFLFRAITLLCLPMLSVAVTLNGPVFIKSFSFEAPNSPEIFLKPWDPKIYFDIDTAYRRVTADFWEASLNITLNMTSGDDTALNCNLQQAGIFRLSDFEVEQSADILQTLAPEILLPFAREAIAEALSKAGFPPFFLPLINFEASYEQKKKQQQS